MKKFSKINTFHKLHDFNFIKRLANTEKIKQIVSNLLETKVLNKASDFLLNQKIKKVPIHQDNYYWMLLEEML